MIELTTRPCKHDTLCLPFRAIVSVGYFRPGFLLLGHNKPPARRIFRYLVIVRTTSHSYFFGFADSIADIMINPAATAFDADQQATPLPPSSSTSPGFVGNGSTHGDRSHPTEDENRDSHRDEEKIDGLTTKYSERPSGTVAQRQMRRFAKSADKRQSVHMLGSIEHLKHHFVSPAIADDLVFCITLADHLEQLKFGLAAQETSVNIQ